MADPQLSFPKEKIHVVLLEGVHHSGVAALRAAGYSNITLLDKALSGADLTAALADAYMVGIRSRTQLRADVLAKAPKLMAIGCFCIGTNQVDLTAAARLGVPVFNAPHSNTRSVAEMVLAEMVMLMRGLGDKSMQAHQGKWDKSAKGSYELRGKTVGIVGYGHIGSQVSILAEAFGMRVVYFDTEPKLAMGNARQLPTLDAVLAEADVVTLHVPAAPDTVNLMSAERIAAMKDGACLINASRGTVVDLEALASHLQSSRLLGAAIDVFPKEPASNTDPFESPLRGVRNVVLTPHIGGSTMEAQKNIGVEVAHKLVGYSDTGATIGAVNFPNISLSANSGAHRLLHVHHNQPGVLKAINQILAESEANILGQHLQTTPDLGYVVTDIDRAHSDDVRDALLKIPGTIRCRLLY